MSRLKAGKSPNEALSLTNRIVLNSRDHAAIGGKRHVKIILPSQNGYIFTVEPHDSMPGGKKFHIYIIMRLSIRNLEFLAIYSYLF